MHAELCWGLRGSFTLEERMERAHSFQGRGLLGAVGAGD